MKEQNNIPIWKSKYHPNWRTNYRNNKGSKVGLSMVDFRIYEHGLEGIPFLSAVTMENRST